MKAQGIKRNIDPDLVPPEVYRPSKKKVILQDLLKYESFPSEFCPLNLPESTGHSNIPSDQKLDEFGTLQLLWSDAIIDAMVVGTNKNATKEKHNQGLAQQELKDQRPWKPVEKAEIYRWLGTLIWMGLHPEKTTRCYWNTEPNDGPIHTCVTQAMPKTRWEQIYRYLHVCDTEVELQKKANNDSTNPTVNHLSKLSAWEKVDGIANYLRANFQRHWAPGTHVAVDECIARFTGRCADIVNIPSKPTPIGHKIWVLSERGYVLDFLWHVRGSNSGQGPQGLKPEWDAIKTNAGKRQFPPTQQVVLELLSRMPNEGRHHCVWLDNLFTSEALLLFLREREIGGAGTVRMGGTKAEETWQKQDEDLPDLPGNPQQAAVSDDGALSNPTVLLVPKEKYRSAADDALPSTELPQTSTTQDSTNSALNTDKKVFANGLHPALATLKKSYNSTLEWGRFFGVTTAEGKVLQFAWRDSSIVLFMSTINAPEKTVLRLRKRPSAANKQVRDVFGGEVVKWLEIPALIDMYNHHMNGVDLADQKRASYAPMRRLRRTWLPLFFYCFETAVSNAAELFMDGDKQKIKQSGHRKFRQACAMKMMSYGDAKRPLPSQLENKLQALIDESKSRRSFPTQTSCTGKHVVLDEKARACSACTKAQRNVTGSVAARKPLAELSESYLGANRKAPRSRPPRTRYGCSKCKIFLCQTKQCWKSHGL
jgi:Transposase IS4